MKTEKTKAEKDKDSLIDIQVLTQALVDKLNELKIPAAFCLYRPDGVLQTRKTDCFINPMEYIGIYYAAAFQESVALWNLRSHITEKHSGTDFDKNKSERLQ